ncbi:hypothetical protein GO003_024950 [Methylicorpusculum oleiharenae]|uniref:hypothetical protein n=1 Tax=Methylicorpusculum oleiharenae TaxID=1338687 RepID=UPI00135A3DFD|nr:hypothetical protein [Methylicorpusculum oleiharenae]MCD2453631.1 hypothetical protein [Methylicorpusculum oleiharenae]
MKKELFESELPNGNVIKYARLPSDTCYHQETPDQVIRLLENLQKCGTEVRIFYGDTQTGQSWHDEFDMVGRIGRSTGSIKIPLIVPKGDSGGPALLDHCIIRIDTRMETLYQHKKFRVGDMTLAQGNDNQLPWEVFIDRALHARFVLNAEATKFMSFLQGNLFAM